LDEKVNSELFETEINYLKNLLTQISEGGDKKIEIQAPPPTQTSNTGDFKKIKSQLEDLADRISALEERASKTEEKTGEHDKEIIKLWDELNKKAN